MPNSRELKEYLTPLLERRPDLAYQQRLLFFRPLRHYLRGVAFLTSSWADVIKFEAACDILFDGGDSPHFGTRHGPGSHRISEFFRAADWKQDPERAWQEVFLKLEAESLPQVQPLDDPLSVDRSMFSSDRVGTQEDRVLGLCALGDFDAAERLLYPAIEEELGSATETFGCDISRMTDDELKFSTIHRFVRLYCLYRVMKRDRSGVFPLLHDWEAHKVKALKLEKYWTPTPFPGEAR